MWQYGGETNLLRSNRVAGVVCDQNYAYKDYPEITRATASIRSGYTLNLTVLTKGNRGKAVQALQNLLLANGWDGGSWGADGNFGVQTEQAVTAYQKANQLLADGKAGPETMGHLLGLS